MSTIYSYTRDVGGYNGYALPFSEDGFSVLLGASTEKTYTVPDDYANYVLILTTASNSNVWVRKNATAAVPTSTVTATDAVMNPGPLVVKAGDVIHMITLDTTANVSGRLYALYNQ